VRERVGATAWGVSAIGRKGETGSQGAKRSRSEAAAYHSLEARLVGRGSRTELRVNESELCPFWRMVSLGLKTRRAVAELWITARRAFRPVGIVERSIVNRFGPIVGPSGASPHQVFRPTYVEEALYGQSALRPFAASPYRPRFDLGRGSCK
jgi:hypothetical protein